MFNDPEILFEDPSIIVISKPAGMVVNRADTTRAYKTVQEWAESKIPNLANYNPEEFSEFGDRGGMVHRLDKETSGILIIAKDETSFKKLQAQFKSREVKKEYTALVHGIVEPAQGEVNVPIGRLPWNRTRFGYLEEGRDSLTLYKTVKHKKLVSGKETEDLTLLQINPQTGRTHQIRVHMRYINHPIFADELYAGRKQSKKDRKILPRHFLHAGKISFAHPVTGEVMNFEAELPIDLTSFLATLVD